MCLKDLQRFFIRGYEAFHQGGTNPHNGSVLTLVPASPRRADRETPFFRDRGINIIMKKREKGEDQLEHLTVKVLPPIETCTSPIAAARLWMYTK